MDRQLQRHRAALDAFQELFFMKMLQFHGFCTRYNELTLQPDRRGYYRIRGELDACERALERLRRHASAGYLTPTTYRAFFDDWATIDFSERRPANDELASSLASHFDTYDRATSIIVCFETAVDTPWPSRLFSVYTLVLRWDGARIDESLRRLDSHPLVGEQKARCRVCAATRPLEGASARWLMTTLPRAPDERLGDYADRLLTAGRCSTCGQLAAARCNRCRIVFYCNAACQRANWNIHRVRCRQLEHVAHELEVRANGGGDDD